MCLLLPHRLLPWRNMIDVSRIFMLNGCELKMRLQWMGRVLTSRWTHTLHRPPTSILALAIIVLGIIMPAGILASLSPRKKLRPPNVFIASNEEAFDTCKALVAALRAALAWERRRTKATHCELCFCRRECCSTHSRMNESIADLSLVSIPLRALINANCIN